MFNSVTLHDRARIVEPGVAPRSLGVIHLSEKHDPASLGVKIVVRDRESEVNVAGQSFAERSVRQVRPVLAMHILVDRECRTKCRTGDFYVNRRVRACARVCVRVLRGEQRRGATGEDRGDDGTSAPVSKFIPVTRVTDVLDSELFIYL